MMDVTVGVRALAFVALLASVLAGMPTAAVGQAEQGSAPDTLMPGEQGAPNPLQRNAGALAGEDLLDAAFPKSIAIPGSDARFRISGYAKVDLIQDLDHVADRFEFELATIAVDGTPEASRGGLNTMHAKESRVTIDVRSVARNETRDWEFPLQVVVEFDFFDDRESFRLQPRLRQAYGVIGRFTAGQTWSMVTDVTALAGTIDFSGGDALYGGRVAVLRFEDRLGSSFRWGVGVEEPSISIAGGGQAGEARSSLPNFAGKLRWSASDGSHLQLGTDVFRLEWQGGDAGPSDTQIAYGLSLTGRYRLGESNKNALSGAATIGSGSANRVISFAWDGGNSAVMTADGLDAMSHVQIYGGYSHYWTESLNSTASVAWAELSNSDFQPGSAIHRATSVHANLVWFPYRLVQTGVEVMWGKRENNDGASGTAVRLQAMTKFLFN